MSPSNDDAKQSSRRNEVAVHDLMDFYRRWSEFRPMALRLTKRSDLSLAARRTVHWLIQLADRVSEYDLKR